MLAFFVSEYVRKIRQVTDRTKVEPARDYLELKDRAFIELFLGAKRFQTSTPFSTF
jgi:hypothetical protein